MCTTTEHTRDKTTYGKQRAFNTICAYVRWKSWSYNYGRCSHAAVQCHIVTAGAAVQYHNAVVSVGVAVQCHIAQSRPVQYKLPPLLLSGTHHRRLQSSVSNEARVNTQPGATISCTYQLHLSAALISCTHQLHSPVALLSCTHQLHSSAALISCTHHLHSSATLISYTH